MTPRLSPRLPWLTTFVLCGLGAGLTVDGRAQDIESVSWPQVIEDPRVTLTIYEPQLEYFEGDSLHSRAAVSAQRPADEEPIFGAVWLGAHVMVDRNERTVALHSLTVTGVRFPGASEKQLETVATIIEQDAPSWDLTISLDWLLASTDLIEQERREAQDYAVDPPRIIVVEEPAVLVLIDGEPVLQQVEGSTLMRVLNTAAFMVLDPNRKKYYLSGSAAWFSAPAATGPWAYEPRPADAAVRLAEKETDQPGEVRPDPGMSPDSLPSVVVSTEPAELVSIGGKPAYSPLANTELLYVTNTESDLFLDIPSQRHYLLLAGRWYRTASLKDGPWTYVDPAGLPESFGTISPDSPKGDVLAHVAGTQAAREAVMDAQVPQTAVVERSTATASVAYDGEPTFEPIEETDLQYAVNTSSAVIAAGGSYYLCDTGVWFVGPAPVGPWTVATTVPHGIYTIPPSCPIYYVRYVQIYEVTSDVVYVGYTPGYTGCYVSGPTVIYGTGYYYRPWYGSVYYPRPVTYGFSVHYNPWTGWSMGYHVGWGGAYGRFHISFHAGYHPWYGPPVYRPPYAHRGPTYVSSRNVTVNNNIYVNRNNGIRSTGRTRVEPQTRPGRTPSTSPATRPTTRPSTQRPNNVVTDRQGNVYKKTEQGWQQRQQNQWTPTDRSTSGSTRPSSRQQAPQTRQLDRELQARQRSADRSQQYRQQRSQPQRSQPQRPAGKRR